MKNKEFKKLINTIPDRYYVDADITFTFRGEEDTIEFFIDTENLKRSEE